MALNLMSYIFHRVQTHLFAFNKMHNLNFLIGWLTVASLSFAPADVVCPPSMNS